MCSDGPDSTTKDIFALYSTDDPRLLYRETPQPARDWGHTPRCLGLQVLADLCPPPDYVLFWDDDNVFFPDALEQVAQELHRHAYPDLLLVPIYAQLTQIPPPEFVPAHAPSGNVDTANLVMRLSLAARTLPYDDEAGKRGFDNRLFDRIRSAPANRITYSSNALIGRYDGLRQLATLRWRLGIPPLGLHGRWWYEPIRRWLRR